MQGKQSQLSSQPAATIICPGRLSLQMTPAPASVCTQLPERPQVRTTQLNACELRLREVVTNCFKSGDCVLDSNR